MYIIDLLNECRLKMGDYDIDKDEMAFLRQLNVLQNEMLQLVYVPFKEKIVGSDEYGWPDGLPFIEVNNLIYKDVINIYADIKGYAFDEMIFRLDDEYLYPPFLTCLIRHFIIHKDEKITFNSIMEEIKGSLDAKFGDGNYHKKIEIYGKPRQDKYVSISELYEQNAAVCIERTAVVHNVLKMLNISSSMLPVLVFDGKSKESHVLNVIEHDDKIHFVDFSIFSKNHANRMPAINVLTKEEYNEFLHGNHQVEFILDDALYTIKPRDYSRIIKKTRDI